MTVPSRERAALRRRGGVRVRAADRPEANGTTATGSRGPRLKHRSITPPSGRQSRPFIREGRQGNHNEALRILWIDDDKVLSGLQSKYLEDRGGCHVECVADGAEGLDIAGRSQLDVIILEWHLPELPSGQILSRLRTEGIRTPVIVFTKHGSEGVAFSSAKLGAAAYLAKPAEPTVLLEAARRVTQPKRAVRHFTSSNCDFIAQAIVSATEAADDPRTFEMWGRTPGVTVDTLHRACELLELDGRDVLRFTRLLRAVLLIESQNLKFAEVLDVAATKTLKRLLARAGLPAEPVPSTVNVGWFLRTQTLIAHGELLRRIPALLGR